MQHFTFKPHDYNTLLHHTHTPQFLTMLSHFSSNLISNTTLYTTICISFCNEEIGWRSRRISRSWMTRRSRRSRRSRRYRRYRSRGEVKKWGWLGGKRGVQWAGGAEGAGWKALHTCGRNLLVVSQLCQSPSSICCHCRQLIRLDLSTEPSQLATFVSTSERVTPPRRVQHRSFDMKLVHMDDSIRTLPSASPLCLAHWSCST